MDAEIFEANRAHLRAVAFQTLGSLADADDAVQEAWIRYQRTDTSAVENLPGWLTTVTARICLDMLRSRASKREDASLAVPDTPDAQAVDPEAEAALADSVGNALLVVLDALSPPERIAFVLHDLFDVAFGDIAQMMERTPPAVRQLASRARAKVRGSEDPAPDPTRRRDAVDAYLAATRTGDFEALLTLLDPQVELRADPTVTGAHRPLTLEGALAVARSALSAGPRARFTTLALVDGQPGLVMAPLGQLCLVMQFAFSESAITAIDVTADPARLATLDIGVV